MIIGLFDSGVGGLSVLRALRRRLPDAPLLYVADSAWAPYGERDPTEILDRSQRLAEWLVDRGAELVVVACNTATAHAIDPLRERRPQQIFIGVEPGIKPAAALTRNGRIGVLATPATLASGRLRALVERYAAGANVHLQPCPGLADAIERGDPVDDLVVRICAPLRKARVDTVVLGCTHYPFAAGAIQAALGPQVRLIDTAQPVAERVAGLWRGQGPTSLRVWTTGDASRVADVAGRLLGVPVPVEVIFA